MGVQERRVRERLETRETILEAARVLFADKGFEAVTMREIAEKIEYSPTAIYFHFRDKKSLLQELCLVDFLALADAFQRIAKIRDPLERLRKIGLSYIDFALTHPNHYRLMFMTPHPPIDYQSDEYAFKGNPEKDAYALLKSTVAEGVAAKCFRKNYKDAELLAQIAWAAMHGIASLHIAKANDPWVTWRPVKKTAAEMVDVVIRGLLREKH